MVKPMQLGHVNIRVKDLTRSEEFYTGVLGLEVTHRRETILFPSSNDLCHELAINPPAVCNCSKRRSVHGSKT